GAGGGLGHVVVVSAESLAAMSTDWAAYASRRSLPVPAADIGRVTLRSAPGGPESAVTVFERTLDSSNVQERGAAPASASRGDIDALTALLDLLTQTSAEAIHTKPPEGGAALAGVELASDGGTGIADLELGLTGPAPQGNPPRGLVVRSGTIW